MIPESVLHTGKHCLHVRELAGHLCAVLVQLKDLVSQPGNALNEGCCREAAKIFEFLQGGVHPIDVGVEGLAI